MHITLIAGARPNFMKIAALIHAIERNNELASEGVSENAKKRVEYRLVHTGQHYDKNMSDTFFEELGIPAPDVNLGCGGGTQAEQTAAIMVAFEKELMAHPTDVVLVVGDVTSTMACSIVAKKLNTKVCHVEAGIRSWDLTMPEEINRMVTDSLADYMFTTSEVANRNLRRLGAYPQPLPERRGECFARVFGAHTADSSLYDMIKENAYSNRKNPTEAESVMWSLLRRNNLGLHFRRQHVILDYIVDFICIEKGLIIELDGGYHNNPEQQQSDQQRTAHLQRLGYTELRFTNEELFCDPEGVMSKIESTAFSLPSLKGRDGERPAQQRYWFVGNVMIDTLLANRARFKKPDVWDRLGLREKEYIVMTMHRPANVDEENHLRTMMEQIVDNSQNLPIIFPIHPRTAKLFYNLWKPTPGPSLKGGEMPTPNPSLKGGEMPTPNPSLKGGESSTQEEEVAKLFPNLHIVEPMGYLEFNYLVERAKAVVTDSGGITEETTVMGVPCITLRDNTERPETCTIGTNELIGTNPDAVAPALKKLFAGQWKKGAIPPLWDGHTSERIIDILSHL